MKGSLEKGQPNFTIIILTFILLAFGIVMVYSSSQIFAYVQFEDSAYFLRRQIFWAIIGLAALFFTMNFPYRYLQKLVLPLLLLLLILMVLVVTEFGAAEGGAQRWLRFGFIGIQPSEFVKLGLIIYLASVYSKKQEYMNQFWRGVFPPLVIVGIFFFLMLLQRDLGTGMAVIGFTMVMIYCSGAKAAHLLGLGAVSIGVSLLFVTTQEYRMARITSYLDPWADPLDSGFQLIQSLYAIGSGGALGRGLGNSIQKHLYLPEAHTDFIFAIIAEELGLVGVVSVLLLYLLLILTGLKVAGNSPDAFGALLSIGIASMIGIQTLINISVVSGILPVTGITLPLISFGGSSLVLTMTSIGVLLNVSRYSRKRREV